MSARKLTAIVTLFAIGATASAADDELFAFVLADRIEHQSEDDVAVWDLQGWYGGDYHKLWWKTEGEADSGSIEDVELQLLYSKSLSAYFDLQMGLRYEDFDTGDASSIVIGIQGLAPYRFELDIAAFVTNDADVLLRGEFERDLLLSQRWVLQPRIELNASLQDVTERNIGGGFNEIDVELRLRYEVRRKFAPYIGVSWQRALGKTGRLLEQTGQDKQVTTFIAGLRFWF